MIEGLEAVAQTYITTQVADAARFWAEPGADPPRLATEVQAARARRQVRGARVRSLCGSGHQVA